MKLLENLHCVPDVGAEQSLLGKYQRNDGLLHTEEDELEIASTQDSVGERPSRKLTAEDFAVDLHSQTGSYESVRDICERHHEKVIDLRPFMQPRPYTCFE